MIWFFGSISLSLGLIYLMRFRKPYKPNNWFVCVHGVFLMLQMGLPTVGFCTFLPAIGSISVFTSILVFMISVPMLLPLAIGYLVLKKKKGEKYAKLYFTAQQ